MLMQYIFLQRDTSIARFASLLKSFWGWLPSKDQALLGEFGDTLI